ncbi:dihydrofolate reductase family protein [Neorhizobium sp. BT27B]|uniref:RibD family protein n=1 Tax=Neorhizobium sp. BT27B TaxID=3142625 RepID=UPI003D27E55D
MNVTRLCDQTWSALLDERDGKPSQWPAFADVAAGELYRPLARRTGRPMVIAQVGQSLDGRVATLDGDARDLSGRDGFNHLHRIRALVDAVVVGVGCVLADDPRLTVRNVSGPNPVRVAIDPNGRIPLGLKLLNDQSRTIIVQADDIAPRHDVETITLSRNAAGLLEPADILASLVARDLTSILIEGGATTIEHFLCHGLLDRLHVCISPIIVGSGLPGLSLPPIKALSQALRPRVTTYNLGSDILFDCDFRAGATPGLNAVAASGVAAE